ncbi:hypothetical protein ACQ9BO_12160 [Flavobacterium sp. P21]|uniref:hypothetical protein n=1 Tax=Flavobacterium sp. P21 TaxID=3423948 RepID=UPI003D669068
MTKEYINERYNQILPDNFNILILEEKYIEAISIADNKVNALYLGNIEIYLLKNILASIEFNDVEKILDPKYKIGQGNSTINININKHLFNHNVGEGILNQLPANLDTESGVEKACHLMRQYIQQEALPFFNYWQDIRDFLPFLESDDINFISDIFYSDALFKKIIIWKLCSHPQYNNFTDKKTEQLTKRLLEIPKDKSFKKNYDRYIKILKTLEKTKPLYEWDEKYLIEKPYIK